MPLTNVSTISGIMVWNVWGGYRLKNNCDDVAVGMDAKTNLCQSVSGNASCIYTHV